MERNQENFLSKHYLLLIIIYCLTKPNASFSCFNYFPPGCRFIVACPRAYLLLSKPLLASSPGLPRPLTRRGRPGNEAKPLPLPPPPPPPMQVNSFFLFSPCTSYQHQLSVQTSCNMSVCAVFRQPVDLFSHVTCYLTMLAGKGLGEGRGFGGGEGGCS